MRLALFQDEDGEKARSRIIPKHSQENFFEIF